MRRSRGNANANTMLVRAVILIALLGSCASAAEQRVTMYGSFGSATDKITTELPVLVKQYYPEITLEIVAPTMISPTAWTQDWPELIENGDYDIFVLPRLGLYNPQANFLPLDRYLAAIDRKKPIFDGLVEQFKIDGLTFILPLTMYPFMVAVNTDIFAAAGVEIPDFKWTWDDFKETVGKITNTPIVGATIDFQLLELLLFQQGIPLTDVSADELASVMRFLYELVELGWVVPGYGENSWLFRDGQAGMQVSYSWTIVSTMRQSSDVTWEVVSIPHWRATSPKTVALLSSTAAISAKTKDPDAAWRVLELLSMHEGTSILAQSSMMPAYLAETALGDWINASQSDGYQGDGLGRLSNFPMIILDRGAAGVSDDLYLALSEVFLDVLDGRESIEGAVSRFIAYREANLPRSSEESIETSIGG